MIGIPCAACLYWHALARETAEAELFGQCRRSAPTTRAPFPGGYAFPAVIWPETTAADWCGEAAPAPAFDAALDAAPPAAEPPA